MSVRASQAHVLGWFCPPSASWRRGTIPAWRAPIAWRRPGCMGSRPHGIERPLKPRNRPRRGGDRPSGRRGDRHRDRRRARRRRLRRRLHGTVRHRRATASLTPLRRRRAQERAGDRGSGAGNAERQSDQVSGLGARTVPSGVARGHPPRSDGERGRTRRLIRWRRPATARPVADRACTAVPVRQPDDHRMCCADPGVGEGLAELLTEAVSTSTAADPHLVHHQHDMQSGAVGARSKWRCSRSIAGSRRTRPAQARTARGGGSAGVACSTISRAVIDMPYVP